MFILGIETSGKNASVAILNDSLVLEQILLQEDGRAETRRLPVCVQELLENHGLVPESLACLAVSRGPGSFTGLRVGLVFAKVFGYATGVPLVPVDTFAATVENIVPGIHLPTGQRIEVVEDLRKGQVAWQRFAYDSEAWRAEDVIAVNSLEEWAGLARQKISFTGMSVERIRKQIPDEQLLKPENLLPEEIRFPDAVAVALLGQREFQDSGAADPFELNPLYIRRSAAEEKNLQNKDVS